VDDPALPAGGPGVDPESEVRLVREAGLAALASPVPLAQFGTQALQRNLNDLGWLERVARAHEAVLDHALASTSIVPFRLCTIYEDERSVRAMLSEQREELLGTLDHLQDRQEWSVKLLVDAERLKAAASAESSEAAALEQELAARSAGGAYMLRRRLERHVRDLADQLGADIAHDVHARLQDWAADAVTNPAQNRELSRHQGEMLLNGAYLVEADKAAALQALVGGLEERYGELGARLELSGPWPPYNFIGRASRYVP
jgi:hypothetical protein